MHSYMWAFGGMRTTPTGEDLADGAAHCSHELLSPRGLTPQAIVVAHPYAPVPGFQKQILDDPVCLCRGGSEHCREEGVPAQPAGLSQHKAPEAHLFLFRSGCYFI